MSNRYYRYSSIYPADKLHGDEHYIEEDEPVCKFCTKYHPQIVAEEPMPKIDNIDGIVDVLLGIGLALSFALLLI